MIRPAPAAIALLMALAACGKGKDEAAPAAPVATAPSAAKASRSVAFTCEGDMAVTAIYGTDADGNPDLALIIRGDDYRLKPTAAPSGQRFASPDGASPGTGIIWWEKDSEVLLQQAPSEQINDLSAAKTARTCKVKTEPTPVPRSDGQLVK